MEGHSEKEKRVAADGREPTDPIDERGVDLEPRPFLAPTESQHHQSGSQVHVTPALLRVDNSESIIDGQMSSDPNDSQLVTDDLLGNLSTHIIDGIGLDALVEDPSDHPPSLLPQATWDGQHGEMLEPLRLVGPDGLQGRDPAIGFLDFDADFADLLKAIGDENGQEAPEPGHSSQEEGEMELVGNRVIGENGSLLEDVIVSDIDFDDAVAALQAVDIDPEDIDFTGDDSFAAGVPSEEDGFLDIRRNSEADGDIVLVNSEDCTSGYESTLDADLSEALGSLSLDAFNSVVQSSPSGVTVEGYTIGPMPPAQGYSGHVKSRILPKETLDNPVLAEVNNTTGERHLDGAVLLQNQLTPEEEGLALSNRLSLNDFLSESGFDPLICGECAPTGHRVFQEEELQDVESHRPTPPISSGGSGRGKPASFVLNGKLQKATVKTGTSISNLNQIVEEEDISESENLDERVCSGNVADENKTDDRGQNQDEEDGQDEEVDPFEAAIAADIAKQRIDLDELLKLSLLSLKDKSNEKSSQTTTAHPEASIAGSSKKKSRAKIKLPKNDTIEHDVRCGQRRRLLSRQKQTKSDSLSNKRVRDAASPFIFSFGSTLLSECKQFEGKPPKEVSDCAALKPSFENPRERSCLGHRDTVFGLSFSPDGTLLATASQDATVRVWNVRENSLMATLTGHNKNHGCLRVAWAPSLYWGEGAKCAEPAQKYDKEVKQPLLASAGADGLVKVWRFSCIEKEDTEPQWACISDIDLVSMEKQLGATGEQKGPGTKSGCLDNSVEKSSNGKEEEQNEQGEECPPHVYALQFVEGWQYSLCGDSGPSGSVESGKSMLLTSSDDFVHLWEPALKNTTSESKPAPDCGGGVKTQRLEFKRCLAFRFGQLNEENGGVLIHSIAGKPGPHHDYLINATGVFVFDASFCQANNLLGAALSDGSMRLINVRGVCVSILQLPGCSSNITSFAWDLAGSRLATSVATGHVVLWDVDIGSGKNSVECACRAVLEGGHDRGRPVFGVKYCGGQPQKLLLSWGSDGKLCIWDSSAIGQVGTPLSVLLSQQNASLFAVDIAFTEKEEVDSSGKTSLKDKTVALAGSSDVSFLGVPVQLFDLS
uniref:Anaphase-promoting complex subunit 4 WD40 domain-containing protein n=1 Tax=Odontella aurita TaxID=265563 RepID=A0A7S4JFF3_9STRA|mmetsp:Transcript_45551/g.138432  ORF Transcript_45551/g.138432 Transcript_45551/m.138432 type:complete len:1108 (+) Transcript_45551:68-3391(+)